MAPRQKILKSPKKENVENPSPKTNFRVLIDPEQIRRWIFDPAHSIPLLCLTFIAEILINVVIIERVPYTEIDWKAYMQEVSAPLNGTFNYSVIRGDTGPLVYPAGFVWIFTGLYGITNGGENIRLAQYIFLVLYLINLALVFRIYSKAKKVPPYAMVLTILTSYRIHSLYVLRLFNDPVAMMFLFVAVNAFLDSRWSLGSIFFSLAVSVKMNILLFAPALLLIYLTSLGIKGTIKQLSICASLQIILALPFLLCDPWAYLKGSFDIGRVFLHQWTVNWRFLPEMIFVSKPFHLILLAAQLSLLGLFYTHARLSLTSYARLKTVESEISGQLKKDTPFNMNSMAQLLLTPLFLCNFIGVVCSRSLHYQFYVWYFNTLPYLTWCTNYTTPLKLVILGLIELSWNTYPSTNFSSFLLHAAHLLLLVGIYRSQRRSAENSKPSQE